MRMIALGMVGFAMVRLLDIVNPPSHIGPWWSYAIIMLAGAVIYTWPVKEES